jgi:hypothetical protein
MTRLPLGHIKVVDGNGKNIHEQCGTRASTPQARSQGLLHRSRRQRCRTQLAMLDRIVVDRDMKDRTRPMPASQEGYGDVIQTVSHR